MAQFGVMTPEMAAQARAAREAKAAAFKAKQHLLIPKFLDERHWKRLASHFGIRMPASYLPCSELKHARRAIRRLGFDYVEWFEERLTVFPKLNPDWPAYAHIGLILEAAAEKAGMTHEELPPEEPETLRYADVEDLI